MTRSIGVTFIFEDELFQVKVPWKSTWAKLRAEWSNIHQQPASEFAFFLDEEGEREMPLEGSLEDVLPGKCRTLTVLVQQLRHVEVILHGAPDTSFKQSIQERTTPQELGEEVRERLGLQQEVRLLLDDRPLRHDVPVVQQTGAGARVLVDVLVDVVLIQTDALTFHPILTDEHDRVVLNTDLRKEGDPMAAAAFEKEFKMESLRVFASDAVQQESPFRLKSLRDGAVVEGGEPIIALMTPDDVLGGTTLFVVMERQIEVEVDDKLSKRRFRKALWPSTKLGSLLTHDQQHVLIDGEAVDAELSLWSAGVQAGCCLTLTSCIQLSVFDSAGRLHSVTADQHEALLDLRQRVRQFATDAAFDLWHDGAVLRPDESSLADNRIFHRSLLYVAGRCRDVRLELEGRAPLLLRDVPEGVRFARFLALAGSALGTQLPSDTRFTCGCGRVLSDENEQRRTLPKQCCSAGQLNLKISAPQLHTHRGATLSATFRLPPSRTLSALLCDISRLCDSGVQAQLQALEASLLRTCLLLQRAAEVRLELDESLDLLLRLDDQSVPWSVPVRQTAFEALRRIEFEAQRPVADLAARSDRPLNVRGRRSATFEDLKLRKGQALTVVFLDAKEKSSQTDFRTSFQYDSASIQVGSTCETRASQSPSPRQIKAATQVSGKTTQTWNMFPIPTRIARFWILASTSDQTYGTFRRENFNLDVPFQTPRFQVSLLREAVADFLRVDPGVVSLEQERARRSDDGEPVFVTEGIGWADSSGRTWHEYEVDRFKVVPLREEDVLPFSASLRWAINAYVQ